MFYSVAAAMDQKADIDDMNKVFLACFPTAETQHRPVIQAIQKMI